MKGLVSVVELHVQLLIKLGFQPWAGQTDTAATEVKQFTEGDLAGTEQGFLDDRHFEARRGDPLGAALAVNRCWAGITGALAVGALAISGDCAARAWWRGKAHVQG